MAVHLIDGGGSDGPLLRCGSAEPLHRPLRAIRLVGISVCEAIRSAEPGRRTTPSATLVRLSQMCTPRPETPALREADGREALALEIPFGGCAMELTRFPAHVLLSHGGRFEVGW